MRRCAIHGTEDNCRTYTIGQCSGVIYETPSGAPDANRDGIADDAQQRLGAFADITGAITADERERTKLQLVAMGVSEEQAEAMMNAPDSPYRVG